MLISIWNYFRGYVMIEVTGFSVERFLNLAVHREIYIWDIERKGNKVTMKIGIKGYKMLKPCAKKTGCRIRIKNKKGLPFIKHRYRKRKMIPMGILIFIILIYTMSSFVWLVEVEGNEKLGAQEIIEKLSSNGYKVGTAKHKMNLRRAEEILLNNFSQILWTGISFEGTKLIIEITEAVPEPEVVDHSRPLDIIANCDGLIVDIVTRKGTPKVKKGDTVQKGDVLVSGQIPLSDEWDEEELVTYTRASADIIAKTHYIIENQLPLKKSEKKYTGTIKKGYNIRILDKKISLYKPKINLDYYDYVINSKQFKVTSKLPLPFYWVWEQYIEYVPKTEIISKETAQDILLVTLNDLLEEKIHKKGEVIKQDVKFVTKGGIMFARLEALVKEEFGEESSIIIHDGRKQDNDKE